MATLFASADRAAATYTKDFILSRDCRGILVYANDTAGSGTVDIKIQFRDDAENAWDDLPGASMTQFTGAAEKTLMLYPGIAATANVAVSIAVPHALRCVAVVGTANATFSVGFQELA